MQIYLEKDDPYLWVKRIFSIFIITGYISSTLILTFGANPTSTTGKGFWEDNHLH